MATVRESGALIKSLIAILLISACLWAAQWQYQRGVDRHARNLLIADQLEKPAIDIGQITSDAKYYEWRTIKTGGQFDPTNQILLKNRYFEGVYGFEVLTRFRATTGEEFWVDRGWVKAGVTASTPPEIPSIDNSVVNIIGRLRLDSSLPRGAFFALPADGGGGMISKLNAQSGLESEPFYLDLLSGSNRSLTPTVPAQLPELQDGPHMAYALQWIFFAGLIGYGRILIRRGEILTGKKLKI